MGKVDFEYGPVARGVYITLLWGTLAVGFSSPNAIPYYIALLLFLGLGLKPLLLKTGLYELFLHVRETRVEKHWEPYTEKKRREIDRQRRDTKIKKSRIRDQDLPKNW